MSPKRIDDLGDLTVHGIWEAHLKGEFVPAGVVDDVAVRAASCVGGEGILK